MTKGTVEVIAITIALIALHDLVAMVVGPWTFLLVEDFFNWLNNS